jgi:t-SNARE complex subunit (syntaxin)
MTDSDTELDWAEWTELQSYLESSERTFDSAIQTMGRLLDQTDELEEMIEQLHSTSLQELEETGECTFGDRILEWIQKIDPSVKEEKTECPSVSSDEKDSLGQEETPTISPP